MLAYAKPKIVMLDDDSSLLDVMEFYFTEHFQNNVLIKPFSKSQDFLSYIEENCYLPESPATVLSAFYAGEMKRERVIKTLHDLIELSAIIVLDHELRDEEITGIDLSTTIREYFPTSYISMLTSNVPTNTAIDLHNNHNIDLFVDKKDTNAVHNLFQYLSKHLNFIKREYTFDCMDLFGEIGNLDNEDYVLHKKLLIEENNPQCFLTLNKHGDIAMMQENKHISFWQYSPNFKQFIEYELP